MTSAESESNSRDIHVTVWFHALCQALNTQLDLHNPTTAPAALNPTPHARCLDPRGDPYAPLRSRSPRQHAQRGPANLALRLAAAHSAGTRHRA